MLDMNLEVEKHNSIVLSKKTVVLSQISSLKCHLSFTGEPNDWLIS